MLPRHYHNLLLPCGGNLSLPCGGNLSLPHGGNLLLPHGGNLLLPHGGNLLLLHGGKRQGGVRESRGARVSKGVILGFRLPTTSVGARGEGVKGSKGG